MEALLFWGRAGSRPIESGSVKRVVARDALLQAQAPITSRQLVVCEPNAVLLCQAEASAKTGLPREKVATTGEIRATASAEQLAATSIILASSPVTGHWR